MHFSILISHEDLNELSYLIHPTSFKYIDAINYDVTSNDSKFDKLHVTRSIKWKQLYSNEMMCLHLHINYLYFWYLKASPASSYDNTYAHRGNQSELHSRQAKIWVNLPKCFEARSLLWLLLKMNMNPKKMKTLHYLNKNIILVFHLIWGLYTWKFHRNENVIHLTSQSLVWRSVRTARRILWFSAYS